MKNVQIPHLGQPIPNIVAGTDWLLMTAPEKSFKALDAAWEAGIRVFDTAHIYGANTNLIAAWANHAGVENEIVYFDKIAHPRHRDGQKISRVTREAFREEVDRNHDRLRVDKTAFCVLHRDDPSVPVGEIVDWLNELKDEGRIEVFGGSNWHHTRVAEANAYAAANGKQGFSLNNPNLTLASNTKPLWDGCLTIDEDGRKWHEETGLPLFSWSSTARGYFARVDDSEVSAAYDSPESQARRERAEELGKKYGTNAVGIALAWVLSQPYPVVALCGLRTVENVKDNVAASAIELTPEELRYLEHGQ